MNKRQKKKAIKIALQHIGTDKFSKKDKRILYTIGREAFKKKYGGMEPEILDNIPELVETIKKTWNNIVKAIGSVFIDLGDAFRNIGRSMQGGDPESAKISYPVTINDFKPVHISKPWK